MCLLVVCHHVGGLDPTVLKTVSDTLSRVIDAARVDQRPVAYIQERQSVGFDGLGLHVGRYEPIFGQSESDGVLPDGLIDFLLRSPETGITLAGFADWSKFEAVQSVLTKAGLCAHIDAAAMSPS
ncbi:MAG: hypothetical protein ACX94B_07875 [Henriciella sp.]|nr:hypothetical protein [Hyphomonadaceae bacterium]